MRPNSEHRFAQVALERATRQLEQIENEMVEREGATGQAVAWGVIFYYRSHPIQKKEEMKQGQVAQKQENGDDKQEKETPKKDAPLTQPQDRRPQIFPVSVNTWYHIRSISLLAIMEGRKILTRHVEVNGQESPVRFYRQDWHSVPVNENDQPMAHYPQFHFRDGVIVTRTLAIAFFRTRANAHRFLREIVHIPCPDEEEG